MNIAVLPNSPETAPQIADPLDHLAEKLFHPMGSDGVYARTALYEGIVEKLAALITSHREAGIGRRLLASSLEQTRAFGLERVELHVYSANIRARRLYESLGFSCTGHRKGYYRDGTDALIFVLGI